MITTTTQFYALAEKFQLEWLALRDSLQAKHGNEWEEHAIEAEDAMFDPYITTLRESFPGNDDAFACLAQCAGWLCEEIDPDATLEDLVSEEHWGM